MSWKHCAKAPILNSPDSKKGYTASLATDELKKIFIKKVRLNVARKSIFKKCFKKISNQINPSRSLSGAQILGKTKSNQ